MKSIESHQKEAQVKVNEQRVSKLRAEGGVSLTVKVRAADIDRLNHMHLFFERMLGISPSNSVLLRWMIEDYMRLIDDMIETCNMLGKRHITEARLEKIHLLGASRDDPRTLPKLNVSPDDRLPTYKEHRSAVVEEESKEFKRRLHEMLTNRGSWEEDEYDPCD